jgi:hypothetical protein
MPEISALGRPRQKDFKFKGSLGYVVRACLKKITQAIKRQQLSH